MGKKLEWYNKARKKKEKKKKDLYNEAEREEKRRKVNRGNIST